MTRYRADQPLGHPWLERLVDDDSSAGEVRRADLEERGQLHRVDVGIAVLRPVHEDRCGSSDRSRGVGGHLDLPDSDACVAPLSLHHPRTLREASGQLSLELGECCVAMDVASPAERPGGVEHVFGADEGDGLWVRAHPHPGGREVEQDPVEACAVLAAADRVDPHEDAVDREQLERAPRQRSRRGRSLGLRSPPAPPGRSTTGRSRSFDAMPERRAASSPRHTTATRTAPGPVVTPSTVMSVEADRSVGVVTG